MRWVKVDHGRILVQGEEEGGWEGSNSGVRGREGRLFIEFPDIATFLRKSSLAQMIECVCYSVRKLGVREDLPPDFRITLLTRHL